MEWRLLAHRFLRRGISLIAVGWIIIAMISGGATQAGTPTGSPISIGHIGSVTGPETAVSEDAVRGTQIAIDEINASGGITGRPLKLIVEDAEYRPEVAIKGIHKLIDVDKVAVTLNSGGSGILLPIAEYAKTQNALIVNITASSPLIRRLKGTVFSVTGLDDVLGKGLAQWVYAKGLRKAAVLVPNNPFGIGVAGAVSAEFKQLGGAVPVEIDYMLNQPDYRPDLQRIIDTHPDVIVSALYGDDGKLLYKQATQMGLTVPWYVAYLTEFIVEDRSQVEGRVFGVEVGYTLPSAEGFRAKYAKRFNKVPPTPWGAYGYDATWLAALAMRKVGTDRDKIRTALPEVAAQYQGATGKIIFDADGQRSNTPLDKLAMTRDGKFVPAP